MGSHCVKPAAVCTNSLDCTADPKLPICDSSTGKCVACVAAKDCPTSNDCVDHVCKAFVMCANSLDSVLVKAQPKTIYQEDRHVEGPKRQ
jgi:hypothetical protein